MSARLRINSTTSHLGALASPFQNDVITNVLKRIKAIESMHPSPDPDGKPKRRTFNIDITSFEGLPMSRTLEDHENIILCRISESFAEGTPVLASIFLTEGFFHADSCDLVLTEVFMAYVKELEVEQQGGIVIVSMPEDDRVGLDRTPVSFMRVPLTDEEKAEQDAAEAAQAAFDEHLSDLLSKLGDVHRVEKEDEE